MKLILAATLLIFTTTNGFAKVEMNTESMSEYSCLFYITDTMVQDFEGFYEETYTAEGKIKIPKVDAGATIESVDFFTDTQLPITLRLVVEPNWEKSKLTKGQVRFKAQLNTKSGDNGSLKANFSQVAESTPENFELQAQNKRALVIAKCQK